jgi:hypothetical protein
MTLSEFCARNLAVEAAPDIVLLADCIRARHGGVAAILAYGSSLRGTALNDTLIDYYVLTDGFDDVSNSLVSRLGCRLVPPNVYYMEHDAGDMKLRAKYAALPLGVFVARMGRNVTNPYFWARFSQPARLIYVRDSATRAQIVEAVTQAHRTFYAHALALAPDSGTAWVAGLRATYASELRPESTSKPDEIVAANRAYYEEAIRLMPNMAPVTVNGPLQRLTGKSLSVMRLIKAAFTFRGGADYLVWKIERHSGKKIELKPWQRRHPIIAAMLLLPKMRRSGAIR